MKLLPLFVFTSILFALSPDQEAKVKELAREFIKDHLKAPATAVFSRETICTVAKGGFEEANGTGPTPACLPPKFQELDDTHPVVYRSNVDAQNSFGALLRSKFQLRVYTTKGQWKILDEADLVNTLKSSCIELNKAHRTLGNGAIRDCDAEFPNGKYVP